MARTRRPWALSLVALLLALGVTRWLLGGAPEPSPLERAAGPEPVSEAPQPRAPAAAREPEAAAAPVAPTRREAIRRRLEVDLAEHFPDRKLSSDELDAAADALMRLRAARLELEVLPRTSENAERIRELDEAMGRAFEDFEYLVDVDPVTFTEQASGETDEGDADEEPQ